MLLVHLEHIGQIAATPPHGWEGYDIITIYFKSDVIPICVWHEYSY